MNQRMLKHSLAASGGDERSGGAGVGSAAATAEEGLDMEVTREALGGSLGRRSSSEELTNQEIFQVCMCVLRLACKEREGCVRG